MHPSRRLRPILTLLLSFALLFTAFVAPTTAATGNREQEPVHPALDSALAEQLDNTPDDESLTVIVYLRRAVETPRPQGKQGRADAIAAAKQGHARDKQQFLHAYKLDADQDFWLGNAVVLTAPANVVRKMARDPQVYRIAPNATVTLDPTEPESLVQAEASAETTWGVAKINAPALWNQGITGEGVTVAVIDTGIYAEHPDLAGRVVGWFDAVNGLTEPYDDKGHGTHVAGTIAGGSASGTQIGVAPGASLQGVKVLDHTGSGSTATVVAGMQWVAENGADVFNMSLGGQHDEAFGPVLDELVSLGIFPAIAAGNAGPYPDTIGSPGDFPQAFTVGATDSEDRVADFSSRGWSTVQGFNKPDVTAPGVGVLSAWPDGGYVVLNGTSMATPHVAGAAALLKQANPDATLDDLKQFLTTSAVALDAQVPNPDSGWGRIDVEAAYLLSQDGGIVTGTVTNSATGKPLSGAIVTILESGRKLYTDKDGRYQTRLRSGGYTLTADAYLFETSAPVAVTVAPHETTLADIALDPTPAGSLQGRVVDLYGRPVISATVSVELPSGPLTTRTDLDGSFFLEQVPAGYRTVTAAGPRIAPVSAEVTLEDGLTTDVELTAPRSVIADAQLGAFNSRDVSLAAAPNGKLTVAAINGDEFDSSAPNLFTFDSQGRYGWTARLGDNILTVAVSANGERVAVIHERNDWWFPGDDGGLPMPFSATKGGTEPWQAPATRVTETGITMLDADGNVLFTTPIPFAAGHLALSGDGSRLVYASGRSLQVFDESGNLLAEEPTDRGADYLALSEDGQTVAVVSGEGVSIYRLGGHHLGLTNQDKVQDLEPGPYMLQDMNPAKAVALSADGSTLVVGYAGRWTPENRRPPGQVRGFDRNGALLWSVDTDRNVEQVALSRDGRTVAAGSIGGTFYAIDGQSGRVLFTQSLATGDSKVLVAVSPEGDRVAASYAAYHQTEVYDLNGDRRSSQYTDTQPLALAGYENLTRLVVAGPAIAETRMTPMQLVVIDTPDAAFVDLAHRGAGPVATGTLRFADYGQDYYYDVTLYRETGELRQVYLPAPEAGAMPAIADSLRIEAEVTGSSRVVLKLGQGDPLFLSADGLPYAAATSREWAASVIDLTNLVQSGVTEWSLQSDAGGPAFEPGFFVIRRY